MPRGATWGGQGRVRTGREAGPGPRTFIRVCGRSALGFRAMAGLVNSNQKGEFLVSPMGVQ